MPEQEERFYCSGQCRTMRKSSAARAAYRQETRPHQTCPGVPPEIDVQLSSLSCSGLGCCKSPLEIQYASNNG